MARVLKPSKTFSEPSCSTAVFASELHCPCASSAMSHRMVMPGMVQGLGLRPGLEQLTLMSRKPSSGVWLKWQQRGVCSRRAVQQIVLSMFEEDVSDEI